MFKATANNLDLEGVAIHLELSPKLHVAYSSEIYDVNLACGVCAP